MPASEEVWCLSPLTHLRPLPIPALPLLLLIPPHLPHSSSSHQADRHPLLTAAVAQPLLPHSMNRLSLFLLLLLEVY